MVLGMRQPGGDDLSTARVAGHEVRFHQTGGNSHVGFHEAAIETDDRSTRRRTSQSHVIGVIPRVVIEDADMLQHPGITDHLLKFVPSHARWRPVAMTIEMLSVAIPTRRACRSTGGERADWGPGG